LIDGSFHVADIVCLVSRWVIDELKFTGKGNWARNLKAYWEERNVADLVAILEAAQFPDPMPEGRFGHATG